MRFAPIFVFVFFFASCSSGNKDAQSSEVDTTPSTTEVDVVDNHPSAKAVDAYLELRDALVESNPAKSAEAAEKFSLELVALGDEDSTLSVAHVAADSLSLSADLGVQRSAFEIVSDNFYLYLKNRGTGRSIYRQYCPMAFNNKGAYWLSDEEAILNPYFGDAMLKCGRVDEEL